ncbi:MAG: hypothetical protein RJB26_1900 [Pseudomonadota bacterium]
MSSTSHEMADEDVAPGHAATGAADDTPAEPVIVPPEELAPELLRAVIEAFVLREGTEYGEREYTLDEKVLHVEQQLRKGEARIVYDPNTQSVDIRRR